MGTTEAQRRESERGQASVELLGVLPALLLAVLAAWQIVLAGHTAWLAGNAARVAARAEAVGRDPGAAARGALPVHLRRGLIVTGRDGGPVEVRVRVPIVVKGTASPLRVGASAALPRQ
jgi:pilus assembly protein CpaE